MLNVLPGWERLQMVVSHVQNTKMRVSRQHGHALVSEAVVCEVEFLQDTVALLRQAGWRHVLQHIC